MRKIKSQEEIERRKKRTQSLLGIILVLLLILSTLGYAFSNDSGNEKTEYNGIKFVKSENYWNTNLQGNQFIFSYLPQEVQNISVTGVYDLNSYYRKVLYFVNLDLAPLAGQEIMNNMGGYLERWQGACLDYECGKDLPVKNCTENIIVFVEGLEGVKQEDNCVYISGDFIKSSDAFLYKVLNIKQ